MRPSSRRSTSRASLTLTIGLGALVLALVQGNEWHWGSTREIALYAIAVIGLASFVFVERRSRAPMVDFTFFRSRTFAGANIVAFIVSFAMLAMFFFMALYMQNVLGYSPLEAGVRFLPSTMMIMFIAPMAGRLTDRVGPRPLITFGLLCVSGAVFWQSHMTVDSGYSSLLPGFVLMGIGMGFVMSPMSTAAMNSVAQTKAGVASGILSMNRMVGGTFGVAILGAMVATLGRSKIDQLLPALPESAQSPARVRPGFRRQPARGSRAHRAGEPERLRLCAAVRPATRRGGGAGRSGSRLDHDRPRGRRGDRDRSRGEHRGGPVHRDRPGLSRA